MVNEIEALRAALRAALAQESEALRRAAELREAGESFHIVNAATREAMVLHIRLNQLQRDLTALQTH